MFIIGKKLNMTQVWNDKDQLVSVTKLLFDKNEVALEKTVEKDGYKAVVIQSGKNQREWRDFEGELKKGDVIELDTFKAGDKVSVTGISKGKGFQGVVKRHNFSGGGASHGHRHDLRQPGSIGSAFPQHVMKGKKMAGRMGGEQVTVKNLSVVSVDKDKGEMLLEGAVPGRRGSLVVIKKRG